MNYMLQNYTDDFFFLDFWEYFISTVIWYNTYRNCEQNIPIQSMHYILNDYTDDFFLLLLRISSLP